MLNVVNVSNHVTVSNIVICDYKYLERSKMENNEPDNELEDARRLNYTLQTREYLIKEILKKQPVDVESSDKSMLISLLDGMDRTVLTRKRIAVDSKQGDAQAQAAVLMAKILTNLSPKEMLRGDGTIPVLADIIDVPTLVSGETDIGTQNLTFDDFMLQNPNKILD